MFYESRLISCQPNISEISWKHIRLKIKSSSPSWPSDLVPEFDSWKISETWLQLVFASGKAQPTLAHHQNQLLLTNSQCREARPKGCSVLRCLFNFHAVIILMDFLFSLLQNELIWSEKNAASLWTKRVISHSCLNPPWNPAGDLKWGDLFLGTFAHLSHCKEEDDVNLCRFGGSSGPSSRVQLTITQSKQPTTWKIFFLEIEPLCLTCEWVGESLLRYRPGFFTFSQTAVLSCRNRNED